MRTEHNPESTWRVRVEKNAGGYAFIKAEHLLKAWWAQRTGSIDLFAFRVWLACHELVARRCRMNRKLTACYRVEELPPLTGSGDMARHRAAIRRLQEAGLLRWLGDDIRLEPASPGDDGDGGGGTDDDYLDMRDSVQNWRRKIPVPRRVIRHLAGQRRKVLIATVLGHLLRCVYYRNRAPLTGGRCKASWIADVFGVDARNVKAARKQLIDAGWLTVVASSQTALNRWGLAVVVALDHTFPACRHDTPARQSPPPRELSTAKSPPPTRNRELSARSENHELRHGRAGGVPTGQGRQAPPPRLRSIALADLKKPQRLDRLFWEAVAAGIVRQTQAERLRWFAAAERAMALGTRNPCGFFAAMVRRGLWHHISNAQEDTARLKLRRLDYGEGRCTEWRVEAA